MKKNNYYVGLLAGVLTAGVLQGSDGKENMPGLGDNPTSIVQGQASGITEELKVAASELAASYDERAEGSQNQAIRGLFRARANHLRATFGVENATESIEPDENDSLYIEKIRYSYAKKLADYYKLKGNEEFAEYFMEEVLKDRSRYARLFEEYEDMDFRTFNFSLYNAFR